MVALPGRGMRSLKILRNRQLSLLASCMACRAASCAASLMTVASDGVRAMIVDDVTEVVVLVLMAGSVEVPDASSSVSFAFRLVSSKAF